MADERDRVTWRPTLDLAAKVEQYRKWLEARECTPISQQQAMTKLVRAGLAEAEKAGVFR